MILRTPLRTRSDWGQDLDKLNAWYASIDRMALKDNRLLPWLRDVFWPKNNVK